MVRTAPHDDLSDFTTEDFTGDDGVTRRVFWKGTGPGVLVMTEIPQITPFVAGFARKVVDAGFTVAMPDLFGTAGKSAVPADYAKTTASICISRDFRMFSRHTNGPVIDWLRALGRTLHERAGGPGIGAIGMCMTGGFALAMSVDAHLLAPVLSQPSMPTGPWNASSLAISDEDLAAVKHRCDTEDLCVLGLRFAGDFLAPQARFDRLQRELGDNFVGIVIPDSAAHPGNRPVPPHSVVTTDLIDEPGEPTYEARERVLALFREKLIAASA